MVGGCRRRDQRHWRGLRERARQRARRWAWRCRETGRRPVLLCSPRQAAAGAEPVSHSISWTSFRRAPLRPLQLSQRICFRRRIGEDVPGPPIAGTCVAASAEADLFSSSQPCHPAAWYIGFLSGRRLSRRAWRIRCGCRPASCAPGAAGPVAGRAREAVSSSLAVFICLIQSLLFVGSKLRSRHFTFWVKI